MKRRAFVKNSIVGATALASTPLLSSFIPAKPLKISLAQWSLHRSINEGKLDPVDFASISKDRYHIVLSILLLYRKNDMVSMQWNLSMAFTANQPAMRISGTK